MRPEYADVPLRLKVALETMADGLVQQHARPTGPSTTVIVPAGAGTASRLTCAVRTASLTS
jgi:hypothetical protein